MEADDCGTVELFSFPKIHDIICSISSLKMYLAEFKRRGELNIEIFLQFNSLKTVFAIRKSLVKLSNQEYKEQQK